jgi:hypothetical protein
MVVVPSSSTSVVLVIGSGAPAPQYQASRPIVAGSIIDSVNLTFAGAGTVVCYFGVVLSTSGVANAAAYGAGTTLLHRSASALGGQPAVVWVPTAGQTWTWRLEAGVRVGAGGTRLLFMFSDGVDAATVTMMASIRVLRMVTGRGRVQPMGE